MFESRGCRFVAVKELSGRQDNEKNQVYLGTDFAATSQIPTGEVTVTDTQSLKIGAAGKSKLQACVNLHWISPDGQALAPNAKLIFYPQYPEVRLSGFLRGCNGGPRDLLVRSRRGQETGRVLLLGISEDAVYGLVLGYEASARGRVLAASTLDPDYGPKGALRTWVLGSNLSGDSRDVLLDELERIHALGWVRGCRLQDGTLVPYKAQNGGGYTLEALLGIAPNGVAEPDFLGWEIKQHGVTSFERHGNPVITLFTPEPSGGVYLSPGFQAFMERYGYQDRNDVRRRNFGGIYKAHGEFHARTGLRLHLNGYQDQRTIDVKGSLALVDRTGEVAAEWSFAKLMEHWRRKHAATCFVPSMKRTVGEFTEYRFGRSLLLATGATFGRFLAAIDGRSVYLDPAMKLVLTDGSRPRTKRRSQFRTHYADIEALYTSATYYGGKGS